MSVLRVENVLSVDDCDSCPFADHFDYGNALVCQLGQRRHWHYAGLSASAPKRPDWCPLDKGDVVVRLRK